MLCPRKMIKMKKDRRFSTAVFFGGDEEDRTLDLTDANRTLSQLSYAPKLLAPHFAVLVYISAKIPICQYLTSRKFEFF